MTKLRVVIYVDDTGCWSVQADPGVEVFSVDELVPDDRVYRMDPASIDEIVLTGEIHHAQDGSPAAARVTRAVREAYGMPLLDIVPNKPN